MSDEINQPPAVTEDATAVEPIPGSVRIIPGETEVSWHDLTDSQKLDILNMKIDSIGTQTSWIGQTLSGIIDMVGKVSPMDIFKMMRGGK